MPGRKPQSIDLGRVCEILQSLAPASLAEEWDNVGLLLEPFRPHPVRNLLLTIDFSEPVCEEAIRRDCQLVISYHPPVFGGLLRLTQEVERQRIVLRSVQAGLAVYSPHTALDSAEGGVNDWLCQAFGPAETEPVRDLPGHEGRREVGLGRLLQLRRPVLLRSLLPRIKKHLGITGLQVAAAPRHRREPIATVALCAGAGGSVLAGARADLLFTGEMRHHDVLAAVRDGRSVILGGHTHTERGYLAVLRDRLRPALPGIGMHLSRRDRAPLDRA